MLISWRREKGYVPRYSKIKVIGYDENDEKVTLMLTDLPAICFQHEIDHLNGIMFYDHINKDESIWCSRRIREIIIISLINGENNIIKINMGSFIVLYSI